MKSSLARIALSVLAGGVLLAASLRRLSHPLAGQALERRRQLPRHVAEPRPRRRPSLREPRPRALRRDLRLRPPWSFPEEVGGGFVLREVFDLSAGGGSVRAGVRGDARALGIERALFRACALRWGMGSFGVVVFRRLLRFVLVLGLFVCCVAPLYVWWLTPEVFNFALITLGLVMWSRGRWFWSAVLLGIAIYSKPTNVFLAAPLLLEPLLSRSWRGFLGIGQAWAMPVGCDPSSLRLELRADRRGQLPGGERKTFYSKFPYETAESTFETGGIWMSTEHVGPLVAGEDEGKETVKTGPARSAEELRASFVRNLGYFWVGRFGGVLPYFPAILIGVLAFLVIGGRSVTGWLCLVVAPFELPVLHLADSGQLVRGRGDGGEPVFPEPSAARSFRVAAGPGALGRGPGRARGTRAHGTGARVSGATFPASGRARDESCLSRVPGRAHHAQRPLRLHRYLAQETPLRRL